MGAGPREIAILGINAHHADAAACLLVDGQVVAAAEEERFRRVKHFAGFPTEAVRACIQIAGLRPDQIGHVAINRRPGAHALRKAMHFVRSAAPVRSALDRVKNARRVFDVERDVRQALDQPPGSPGLRVHHVEHHMAHLASAFFASPYKEAAVVSVDGFGDFVSSMWGHGRQRRIGVHGRVHFPHSLGQMYLVLCQFLGFTRFGDEGKVMGLAASGSPTFLDRLRSLIRTDHRSALAFVPRYFRHATGGVSMEWDGGTPKIGTGYTDALVELLGEPRGCDDPITQRHKDIAASTQALFEEQLFRLLNRVRVQIGDLPLTYAGGCALNSAANGQIAARTGFSEVYVPSAPADAGGAIGAALSVWHETLGGERSTPMKHAFLGPSVDRESIAAAVLRHESDLSAAGITVVEHGLDEVSERAARLIADGAVVGWVQGRMEFGPRALGHRSILADPRDPSIRDRLNKRVKLREDFRPFAPAVLAERMGDWFNDAALDPFMSRVAPVLPERRAQIPAVTHVDGTARVQSVGDENPDFRRIIEAFERITGVPILVNTSFNENEPIVASAEDAIQCFLRTDMDALVLGGHLLERRSGMDRRSDA